MKEYKRSELTASVPLSDFRKKCLDPKRILSCCQACSNYQQNWTCPPLPFDCIRFWNCYKTLELHAVILTPLLPLDSERFFEIYEKERTLLTDQMLVLEQHLPGSLALAAGSCTLCEQCTRPSGRPCLHPDRLRYSIEALGGDVSCAMEAYFHLPLQWSKDGSPPPYLTAVAGLLRFN